MYFLEYLPYTMAAEIVQGKVYAAFIFSDKSFDSRPLLAGKVKLVPGDGVTYKRLEAAAELNGNRFWTKIIVEENEHLPWEEVEAEFKQLLNSFRSRYEKKVGRLMTSSVARLGSVVSGLTFVDKAVGIAVFSAETAERFWLLRDNPSLARRLPYNALPSLPGDNDSLPASSLPAEVSPTPSLPASTLPAPTLPEVVSPIVPLGDGGVASSAPGVPKEGAADIVALAVEQIDLGNGAEVEIVGEVSRVEGGDGGGEFSGAEGGEEGGEIVGPVLDLDREVEDALQQAESLSVADRATPVYSSLVATIRRLQGSHRKQGRMITSLNQLSAAQELRLQSYQASSAVDIAEGLSPALKKAVGEMKKDMRKEIRDELEDMKKEVVEEGKTALAQELAAVKSSLSILSVKVAELAQLGQSTMGAAALINESLKASGIMIKEDPLSQVDIPEVLLQISSNLNAPASTPMSPGKAGLPLKGILKSSNNSSPSVAVGGTPRLPLSSSFDSPAPSRTPRKRTSTRWSSPTPVPPVAAKNLVPGQRIKQNLSVHFAGSQGISSSSNSGGVRDVLTAKRTLSQPQLSQAQINQRLKQLGALAAGRQARPRKE